MRVDSVYEDKREKSRREVEVKGGRKKDATEREGEIQMYSIFRGLSDGSGRKRGRRRKRRR